MVLAYSANYKASRIFRWFEGSAAAIVLLIAFFLVTAPQFYRSIQASNGLQNSWLYATFWLESAECAKKTGAILVLCRDGKLIPIADETSGDDLGHALSLELFAMATHKQIVPSDISILNSTVNYFGLIVLSLLLFTLQLPFVTFLVLTIGPEISDQFHRLTPHPAQFGAACLAAILPLAILGFINTKSDRRSDLYWLIAGFLCLAISAILRQAIGMMGVAAGLVAVVLALLVRSRTDKKLIQYLIVVIGILIVSQTSTILLRARDAVYHLPPTKMMESHGAWHNLYIGLGAVPNPFGIERLDANGLRAAQRIDPTVKYLSADYYATLRSEYFRILRQHPLEAMDVYFRKFVITLNTQLVRMLDIKTSIVIICILAAASRWRRREPWRTSDSVLAISSIFAIFFIGQATLLHFDMQYLFPIKIFLVIAAGTAFDSLFRRAVQRQRQ